jgi:hypothetical protein
MFYIARKNYYSGTISHIQSLNRIDIHSKMDVIKHLIHIGADEFFYIPNSCVKKMTGKADGWTGDVYEEDFVIRKAF